MTETLILHEDTRSGNCYKISLTAALLGLSLERRQYDIMRGETRSARFLAEVDAEGRIPVLQVGPRFLPESNAALWYLGHGTKLVPADPFDAADCLRWMFWEQCSHEPNIATLRFWFHFLGEAALSDYQRAQIPAKRVAGEAALARMDQHLATREWLVGSAISLADIALFAYTHLSEAGGFRLRDYAHVCRWLERVARQPGFVPMG